MELLTKMLRNKKGQALSEYALIIGLIAVGCIAVLGLLSGKLQAVFQTIVNALT